MNNFIINNIDVNIIAQKPKIKKYKVRMEENIAKICQISKQQINIRVKQLKNLV